MIKSIDKSSVHRITSGQVLVDLQTAVKELVENSLDAGSTNIEVKFTNHGVKQFEVIDNGSGVSPEDYESVALKHCTSKISSFEDLSSVETFGFRGEALSSLCALSESVTLTTATAKEAPMGTVLEFGKTGKLTSQSSKVARQRGTTVVVKGFFAPLTVRRKELERNAKREFGKALNLLNAYALVPCTKENKGVRLSVVHIQDGGRKSVQFRTDGKTSLKSSITSLWGPKQVESLTELDLTLEVVPERSVLRRQAALGNASSSTTVHVRGLISKFNFGCGRAGPDRQFFFINGRPCNPSKIQKTFNEVYRSFNTNQSPFVIADFILPTDSCDVNVSPDKRTILLHSENALVAALKEALEERFAPSRSTFAVQPSLTQRELTSSARPSVAKAPSADITMDETTDDVPINSATTSEDLAGASSINVEGAQSSRPLTATSREQKGDPKEDTFQKQPSSHSESPTSKSVVESELDPLVGMSPNSPISETVTTTARSPPPRQDTDKSLSKPVQMVLSTRNASWAILPASEEPVPKKRKVDIKKGAASLASLRSQLASFAAPGSQAVRLQEDEEIEEEDEDELLASEDEIDIDMTNDTRMSKTVVESEDILEEQKGQPSSREREDDDVVLPADDPLFLIEDTEGHHDPDELNKPNSDVRVKSEEDDIVMLVEDDDTSNLENERLHHLRSLDQSPSASSSVPDAQDNSSSVRTVRTEVLKTKREGLDMTVSINTSKIEAIWVTRLQKQTGIAGTSSLSTSTFSPSNAQQQQQISTSAGISNTTNEADAGQALSRMLDKKDFAMMEVIGQFNLGFIIARLRHHPQDQGEGQGGSEGESASGQEQELPDRETALDDLFIVDQHASDEKYNFETLQQTTRIASQRLVRPRTLELTAADELVAIENTDILKANGFEIEVADDNYKLHKSSLGDNVNGEDTNEDGNEVGSDDRIRGRVKLVAQPVSGNTTFTIKDFEELLHLLSERPTISSSDINKGQGTGGMIRCSKARAMFAMRACRKSVMIGTALNKSQMTSIIRHMGTIDQPWNCPHGRPTMRHLVSLDSVALAATAPTPSSVKTTSGSGRKPRREDVINWSNL